MSSCQGAGRTFELWRRDVHLQLRDRRLQQSGPRSWIVRVFVRRTAHWHEGRRSTPEAVVEFSEQFVGCTVEPVQLGGDSSEFTGSLRWRDQKVSEGVKAPLF